MYAGSPTTSAAVVVAAQCSKWNRSQHVSGGTLAASSTHSKDAPRSKSPVIAPYIERACHRRPDVSNARRETAAQPSTHRHCHCRLYLRHQPLPRRRVVDLGIAIVHVKHTQERHAAWYAGLRTVQPHSSMAALGLWVQYALPAVFRSSTLYTIHNHSVCVSTTACTRKHSHTTHLPNAMPVTVEGRLKAGAEPNVRKPAQQT